LSTASNDINNHDLDELEDHDDDGDHFNADFDSIIDAYDREIEDPTELDFMVMDLSKILSLESDILQAIDDDEEVACESFCQRVEMEDTSAIGTGSSPINAQDTILDIAPATQISSNDSDEVVNLSLVTTPFLQTYGLAFNTIFNLIICVPCRSGWSLSHIHRHLRSTDAHVFKKQPTRYGHGEPEAKWTQVKVLVDHNPAVQRMAANPKFQATIIDSLKKAGHIDDGTVVRQEAESLAWKNVQIPGLDDQGRLKHPIQGIDVFDDCYGCPIPKCRFIARNLVMLYKHRSQSHGLDAAGEKGSTFISIVRKSLLAQTLTELNGFVKLFEVLPQSSDCILPTSQCGAPDVIDVVSLLRQKKADIIQSLDIPVTDDVRTLLPVFVNSGIHGFLHKFDYTALLSLLDVPRVKNPPLAFKRLRQILIASFWNDLKLFEDINSTILNLITNCTP
jgi:hypothetical protein